MKTVYGAITEEEALDALMRFKETWGKKYPSTIKSWEDNWDRVYFKLDLLIK